MSVEWKNIIEITDKDILGTDGLSSNSPRKKSRAILIDEHGRIAVIHEKKTGHHMLPGGAIESGEDELAALTREIAEETGCSCDIILPLCLISENRCLSDTTRLSYFFVVHTTSPQTPPRFTREETLLETTLKWCLLSEALRLIDSAPQDAYQNKFIRARDLAALNAYVSDANTR